MSPFCVRYLLVLFVSTVTHEVAEDIAVMEIGELLGETDNCRNCRKNPGHKDFVLGGEFSLEHLRQFKGRKITPPGVTLEDLADWIQSSVPLTVRLEGKYVSLERPEDGGYVLSQRRGEHIMIDRNVGSGVVVDVIDQENHFVCDKCSYKWSLHGVYNDEWYQCRDWRWCYFRWKKLSREKRKVGEKLDTKCSKHGEEEVEGKCPKCSKLWWWFDGSQQIAQCPCCDGMGALGCHCDICNENPTDRKSRWWKIEIETAKHVIFDTSEAQECDVAFFDYGGEESPVRLTAGQHALVDDGDTSGDWCWMSFYTCDEKLVEKLRRFQRKLSDIEARIKSRVAEEEKKNKVINETNHGKDKNVYESDILQTIHKHDKKNLDKKTYHILNENHITCNAIGEFEERNSVDTKSTSNSDVNDDKHAIFNNPLEEKIWDPFILIGYPHGRKCYVTVGELERVDEKGMLTRAYYTAKSCSGNSGCIGLQLNGVLTSIHHKHSGCVTEDGNTLGKSTADVWL